MFGEVHRVLVAAGCAGTRTATHEARVRAAVDRAVAISGLTEEAFRHELSGRGLDERAIEATLEGGQVGAAFLLAAAEVAGTTVGVLLEEAPLSQLVAELTGRVRALEEGRKSPAP